MVVSMFMVMSTVRASSIEIQCCDLWYSVTRFVSVSTGESIHRNCPTPCTEDPTIMVIVKNVYPSLKQTSNGTYSVNTEEIFTSTHVSEIIAWSIIGRLCSVHDKKSNHAEYLEFNMGSQTLSLRKSGCEYHKVMYSTLLGFCIVILTFVLIVGILSRIVEEDKPEIVVSDLKGQTDIASFLPVNFKPRDNIRYRLVI